MDTRPQDQESGVAGTWPAVPAIAVPAGSNHPACRRRASHRMDGARPLKAWLTGSNSDAAIAGSWSAAGYRLINVLNTYATHECAFALP